MDQIQDLDMRTPVASPRPRGRLRGAADRAVLWLHRQADRADLLPADFGAETHVDPNDAEAVRREWVRQAHLWADHNPEEMLAWKAGGVALVAALLVLVVLIRALG